MVKLWIASLTRWLDGRGWKDVAPAEASIWQAPPRPQAALPTPAPVDAAATRADDRRRIADTFDAAHPVRTRGELFGREAELGQLLAAVLDFHQHAVIHGARGSGKTSLVRVLGDHADESGAVVLYFACEPSATFADLLRLYLDALPAGAFAPGGQRAFTQKLEQLPADFGPRAFVDLVTDRIVTPTILIFDEFDRIEDVAVKTDVAAAMKLLSDALVPVLFVLVGVARTVSDVVTGHPSLRRHMRVVSLGRISPDSVNALIDRGEANTRVRFDAESREMIASTACGSPYHLRMLAGNASLAAIAQGNELVTKEYTRTGFVDVFSQWSQMNEPDGRLFARAVLNCLPDQRIALESLARAAAATDVVAMDSDRFAGAIASIEPALIREHVGDGEPDTVHFRDSTAPQMLLALLMTMPVSSTAARTGTPQESDLANTR
jgi:hypothetical protein